MFYIDFDWAGHPPHKYIHPDDDPLMRPLFGGFMQWKIFAPSVMLVSLFTFLILWTSFFVGSDPETDAYFFAVEQKAESVCIGEIEYTSDMYASVPVVWKDITGEEVAAKIEMVKENRGVNFGEHWETSNISFDNSNACPSGNWRQTAWSSGIKTPNPGGGVGDVTPEKFYADAQQEYMKTRQDIVSLTNGS